MRFRVTRVSRPGRSGDPGESPCPGAVWDGDPGQGWYLDLASLEELWGFIGKEGPVIIGKALDGASPRLEIYDGYVH